MPRNTLPARRFRVGRKASTFLAVSTLSVLTGCGATDEPVSSGEVDVSHVHALSVDPENPDRLYLATHEGLASYSDDDGLVEVGENRSDFMGFAIGPEGTMYASGHPGEGEGGPFTLGLISSDDSGTKWEDVSLSGEADFHALDANADGVYGFDAANAMLRVSEDGKNWTDIPSQAGFIDLAADPNSNRVVGSTPEGTLLESTDGGRTFDPVPGAPPLILVDFSPEGDLVGIDSQGRISRVDDDGGWEAQEGQTDDGLQAFTAGPDGVVWLLDGAGLRRSADGGSTFEPAPAW